MPFHATAVDDLARRLQTHPVSGLTETDARQRLLHAGPNVVGKASRPQYFEILVRQIANPLLLLLVAAAGSLARAR